MSKEMGKKLKKPVCCAGTYWQVLNLKQHVQKDGKRGHIIEHKYRKVAQTYKNNISKTKAQKELGLVKDAEENQKWFP